MPPGGDRQLADRRGLGAELTRVDCAAIAINQVVVKRILDIPIAVLEVEDAAVVGFILRKHDLRRVAIDSLIDVQPELSQREVAGDDRGRPGGLQPRFRFAAVVLATPRPVVAEPQRREHMNRRRFRPAISDGEADQHVVGRRFGVLGEDVEVAILVERARINEFELRIGFAAATILFDKPAVGKLALRILIQRLHVGMRGRRIEIVVALLYILAMIALRAGETEEPFLEDWVAAVPECQREAEPALAIANAQQAVLAPAVGPAAGVVVREVAPGFAKLGVILAHGAPLPLGKIRAKALPVSLALSGLLEPSDFFVELRLDCHVSPIVEQQLMIEPSRFPQLSHRGKQFANLSSLFRRLVGSERMAAKAIAQGSDGTWRNRTRGPAIVVQS